MISMSANNDSPERWNADIAQSVDFYNSWFLEAAPLAFRQVRSTAEATVRAAIAATNNLRNIGVSTLSNDPAILATLRMATAPPIAVDRLIGLAQVPSSMVKRMEKVNALPTRQTTDELDANLRALIDIISRLLDRDLFVWLQRNGEPTTAEIERAASVVADRMTGAITNPALRGAQERRQLESIRHWLEAREYRDIADDDDFRFDAMAPGTFRIRANVPAALTDDRDVNIPVDVAIMPQRATTRDYPILLEAKSAGDFTNVNKRRKEEAAKVNQLRRAYGRRIRLVLFLGGYFDSGYLGYEAAERIDWVWEHRPDDFEKIGL